MDDQITDVLVAIQTRIRTINGQGAYTHAVKYGSVVLDPINLLLVHESLVPLVSLELTDTGEREYFASGQLEDRVVIAITTRLDAPGAAYDRKTIAATTWEADVERSLAVDPTLDGLAIDSRVRPMQLLTSDPTSDLLIVLQLLDVNLTRDFGSPEG